MQQVINRGAQEPTLSEEERIALLTQCFQIIQVPLTTQLIDLRSTVTRETILTLVNLAKNYPNEFGIDSSKYFNGSDGFLKLLNNGKRLISDMAHDGILQILDSVCIPK